MRRNRPPRARRGRRPSARVASWLSRGFLLGGLLALGGLAAGFAWFADTVTRLQPPTGAVRADAAVSLTGGSDARLKSGITLMQTGRVTRLLISGVNPSATTEDIRSIAGGERALYACCVTLGRTATDTVGNAREIREWTEQHDIASIILVTDSYHMPRSLLEVRRAVPGIQIIPWPTRVGPYASVRWWQDEVATRGLALEYGKYLVVRGRALLGLPPEIHSDPVPEGSAAPQARTAGGKA